MIVHQDAGIDQVAGLIEYGEVGKKRAAVDGRNRDNHGAGRATGCGLGNHLVESTLTGA